MAFPLDTAAQSAALDAMLGDNRASTCPTSFEVALFTDHPLNGGTELTSAGGYARVVVANTSANFPDAVAGAKTSVPVSFGIASDAYSDTATCWVLFDHADSTTRWFVGRPDREISIDEFGDVAQITLEIFWNTTAA
jgi:hypothetical protein